MSYSRRPTYSLSALQKYLTHISLPAHHQTPLLQNLTNRDWTTSKVGGLKSLQALQKYQQAKIPFTNLYLHYSKHHVGTMDAGALYEYIVESKGIAREGGVGEGIMHEGFKENLSILRKGRTERERAWDGKGPSGGRGGSCTLNNGFFGAVMRSLGLSVKSTGARVSTSINGGEKGRFGGWNHLVQLVGFEGKRYLVDVGFGGNGPTEPVLLEDGYESQWGVTGDKVRLIWSGIQEYETPGEKCWILQHQREGKLEWDDIYCFTEHEFLPQDLVVMNFMSAGDVRRSFFNHMIICLRNEMEGEDVVGVVSMTDGKVKRRIRGKSETVAECKSEVERWEALEKWFGIVLGEQERLGIKGMMTELGGQEDEGK